MGVWGVGIFQDDLAADVRGSFEAALERGLSIEAATREVLSEYAEEAEDPEEGPVVWLALAALQSERGALQPDVRARALTIIDMGQGLVTWAEAGPQALAGRKEVLESLRATLSSTDQNRVPNDSRPQRTRVRPKIGDCFVIPLPDGRRAYGQYVYNHRELMGPLVQIFDLISEEEVPVEELMTAGPLFPPVFTGLHAAISDGRWRIIGKLPTEEFVFPKFRFLRRLETPPGLYRDWWIWDGEGEGFVGVLPPEYRRLELLESIGYELVEHRIATGDYLGDKLL